LPLDIRFAGCTKAEREHVEVLIRTLLEREADAEPWSASFVKIGSDWSVTLEASRRRRAVFKAPNGQLEQCLREQCEKAGLVPPLVQHAAAPPISATLRRERQTCGRCVKAYLLVYEAPDEALELASVACPYCWYLNSVRIAGSVVADESFRAERLEET
jgi:hypothetical protein